MNIKMLALDLDGTLTNSEKKISKRTKQVLNKAMKLGVNVVLASGRPTVGIEPLALELNLKELGGYILAYNGGKIIDCKTETEVYANVLPMECIPVLYETVRGYDASILTYLQNQIVTEDDENPYVLKECMINKTKAHKVEDFVGSITEPVPKCLIVGEHQELLRVKSKLDAMFGTTLNIFFSEPYFLEIMPLGVEKSASLDRLLTRLQMDRSQLMACGDGLNDLTMLEFAGLSIAMENGCQEAKEIADVITASNDDDGVALAVEKYIIEVA